MQMCWTPSLAQGRLHLQRLLLRLLGLPWAGPAHGEARKWGAVRGKEDSCLWTTEHGGAGEAPQISMKEEASSIPLLT